MAAYDGKGQSPEEQAVVLTLLEYMERPFERGTTDCATMVAKYLERLTGEARGFEDRGKPATRNQVSALLGDPAEGLEYGDVVIGACGGLGINLGYCILTVTEQHGLARCPPDTFKAKANWRPTWRRSA